MPNLPELLHQTHQFTTTRVTVTYASGLSAAEVAHIIKNNHNPELGLVTGATITETTRIKLSINPPKPENF